MRCFQVSLEELDGLQQELEAALSAVVVSPLLAAHNLALLLHFRCESESCALRVTCCRILKNTGVASKRYTVFTQTVTLILMILIISFHFLSVKEEVGRIS